MRIVPPELYFINYGMGVEAEHPVTKEFVTVIASHKAITHRPLW